MNPLRSLGAIIAGIGLILLTGAMLPSVVTHTIASVLAGYLIARLARVQELRHAGAAAALLSAIYLLGVLSDNPALPPMWTRVALLLITAPAIIAGAWIRAQAQAIRGETNTTGEQT